MEINDQLGDYVIFQFFKSRNCICFVKYNLNACHAYTMYTVNAAFFNNKKRFSKKWIIITITKMHNVCLYKCNSFAPVAISQSDAYAVCRSHKPQNDHDSYNFSSLCTNAPYENVFYSFRLLLFIVVVAKMQTLFDLLNRYLANLYVCCVYFAAWSKTKMFN